MRILVTGSRDWTDRGALWMALNQAVTKMGATLVHGDCPTGADALAQEWADCQPDIRVERYPANWSLGKKAGPLRNQYMVDLGADICLAFPKGDSRGTRDCIRRAEAAGIKVIIHEGE